LPPAFVITLICAPDPRPKLASAFEVTTRNSWIASVEITFGTCRPKLPGASPAVCRSSLALTPSMT
jgi:hypothetical protein